MIKVKIWPRTFLAQSATSAYGHRAEVASNVLHFSALGLPLAIYGMCLHHNISMDAWHSSCADQAFTSSCHALLPIAQHVCDLRSLVSSKVPVHPCRMQGF